MPGRKTVDAIRRWLSAFRFMLRTGRVRHATSSGVSVPPHSAAIGDTLKEANTTWTLTGPNSELVSKPSGTFSGVSNLSDTGGGTLKARGAVWTLTGLNTGSVTNLSGTFAGMANLSDAGGGTLKAKGATWTITGPNSGTVTNLSGTFAGMVTLSDPDSRKDT